MGTWGDFFRTVKGLAMIGLVFLSLLVCSQAALTPTAKVQLSVAEKLMIAEDLQDEDLVQDVEALIAGLDDATLVKLQKILSDDLTIDSELQLIESELTEMGMEWRTSRTCWTCRPSWPTSSAKFLRSRNWSRAMATTRLKTMSSCTC